MVCKKRDGARPETQHKPIHDTLGRELTLFGFCAILFKEAMSIFLSPVVLIQVEENVIMINREKNLCKQHYER